MTGVINITCGRMDEQTQKITFKWRDEGKERRMDE